MMNHRTIETIKAIKILSSSFEQIFLSVKRVYYPLAKMKEFCPMKTRNCLFPSKMLTNINVLQILCLLFYGRRISSS